MKNVGILGLLLISPQAMLAAQCDATDPDLVHCPAVRAPDGFQLKSGYVILEYSVETDGSVRDLKVIESDPSRHWNGAALYAVSRWRYVPADKVIRKIKRLDFYLDPEG